MFKVMIPISSSVTEAAVMERRTDISNRQWAEYNPREQSASSANPGQ